jgi:putative ABC transport system substrate-binding protein
MRRRDILTLLGSAAAAWPMPASAQQRTAAVPVVGFLNSGSPDEFSHLAAAFAQGLRDNGFIDGQNVTVDYRWARGQYDRLPGLATELLRRNVAVICASGGTSSVLAAKRATNTVPIVFIGGGDPVEDGLVTSLSRPGGNMTGMTVFSVALGPKRLELMHELVPTATNVAMLVNPTGKTSEREIVQSAAADIGLRLQILNVSTDRELDSSFDTMVEQRTGGLLVTGDPFFTSRRDQLILLTTRHGIPTVFPWREYAIAGGLLSYGTSLRGSYRQMAGYVARILKGANPAELPVQQPSTFEFVLNLKAAKTLGITIPTTILLRADEVIEEPAR